MRIGKAEFGLVFASVAITYLAFELIFFPVFLHLAPLSMQINLGPTRILAQSSKNGTIPQDYVALVGDSYAQGAGDWLMDVAQGGGSSYHSAHIIHEATGHDVITFGSGGADSIKGNILLPRVMMERINSAFVFDLQNPSYVISYFYEGNDFNNNLERAQRDLRIVDDQIDAAHLEEVLAELEYRELGGGLSRLTDHVPFFATLLRMLRSLIEDDANASAIDGQEVTDGTMNLVHSGGAVLSIPDGLPSYFLELDDAQLAQAADVFDLALAQLMSNFPDARVGVVYIPSPLSSYSISSPRVSIQKYKSTEEGIHEVDFLRLQSNKGSALIEKIASVRGAAFIDARPYIRARSRQEFIHGPRDWSHFNQAGYEALGEAAVTLLRRMEGKGETEARQPIATRAAD